MSLGNGYRSTTEKVAFIFMFILKVCLLGTKENQTIHNI